MSQLQIVSNYLVDNLKHIKKIRSVRVMDEGAILVDVAHPRFHEDIMIYVVAGELSVGFIKKTLNANTNADRHTLYIVSLELIAPDGLHASMTRGLRLLLEGFAGRIYVYTVMGTQVHIFPVRVDRQGNLTPESPVRLEDLSGEYATFDDEYLLGVRKIAGFNPQSFSIEIETPVPEYLVPYFDRLDAPTSATISEVKRAYRRKARQNHPDTDPSPGATERMQAINEAYQRILEWMGDE